MEQPLNKSYSQRELLEIFPEAKPIVLKQLRAQKKQLSAELGDMDTARSRMVQSETPGWFVELFDEQRRDVRKAYDRVCYQLDVLLKPPTNYPDNTSLAKLVPMALIIGSNLQKIRCPFHDERTPSCKIYVKTNSFYCFGCGKSGDSIDMYMQMHGVDFRTATAELARLV